MRRLWRKIFGVRCQHVLIGYVHRDTARQVGWQGVPLHYHTRATAMDGNHVAVYVREDEVTP